MTSEATKMLMKKFKKTSWKKHAKEAQPIGGLADLPDGNYVAKVGSTKFDVHKDGYPFVQIVFIILSPSEDEGKQYYHFQGIRERGKLTEEGCIEMISSDLQKMGVDMSDVDISDFEGVLAELAEEKPTVKFRLVTSSSGFQNCRLQGLAEDDEEGEVEDDEEPFDEEEEEEEDDEEEEDEDEEEEEDEEEDDEIPEKGEAVMYSVRSTVKPKPHTVVRVNAKSETATLKRDSDGKVFKDVPWSKFSPADD